MVLFNKSEPTTTPTPEATPVVKAFDDSDLQATYVSIPKEDSKK
jgi:hypothetical protein